MGTAAATAAERDLRLDLLVVELLLAWNVKHCVGCDDTAKAVKQNMAASRAGEAAAVMVVVISRDP